MESDLGIYFEPNCIYPHWGHLKLIRKLNESSCKHKFVYTKSRKFEYLKELFPDDFEFIRMDIYGEDYFKFIRKCLEEVNIYKYSLHIYTGKENKNLEEFFRELYRDNPVKFTTIGLNNVNVSNFLFNFLQKCKTFEGFYSEPLCYQNLTEDQAYLIWEIHKGRK